MILLILLCSTQQSFSQFIGSTNEYAEKFLKNICIYILTKHFVSMIRVARNVSILSEDVAKCHRLFIAGSRAAGGLKHMRRLFGSARVHLERSANEYPVGGNRSRRPCTGGQWGCRQERYTETDLGRRPQDRPWVQRVVASPVQKRRFHSQSHRRNCKILPVRYPALASESRLPVVQASAGAGAVPERRRLEPKSQSKITIKIRYRCKTSMEIIFLSFSTRKE